MTAKSSHLRLLGILGGGLLAATAVVAATATSAAATSVTTNDNASSFTYSSNWTYTQSATGYLSGDAHYATAAGAQSSITFTGPSISLLGGTNDLHGRADVKVCDASGGSCGSSTTIDTYSSTRLTQQTIYTAANLGAGSHTLVVTVRSDSSGSGTYTDIDGIITDDGLSPITGTHYVDNAAGSNCSDAGAGTSTSAPWCSFAPVQNRTLSAGAQLLLKRGDSWTSSMTLYGSGTSTSWITIGAYGTGSLPVIRGNDQAADRTIVLKNPDYWHIQDLELSHAGNGVLIEYTTLGHNGLDIHGLNAHDLNGIFDGAPAQSDYPDLQNSAAVTISAAGAPVTSAGQVVLNNATIRDNVIHNAAGVYVQADPGRTGTPAFAPSTFSNMTIAHNNFSYSAAPILAVEAAQNAAVESNWIDCSGHQAEPQGTTCAFFSQVASSLVQNNVIMNMPNTNSPDETGIDFEYKIQNTAVRGNYFANNAGAGIELLQLQGRPGDFSTGNTIEENTFYNNGGASSSQKGHIAIDATGTTGPTVTIQHNNYQSSPNGFISDVNGTPNLTNVTQSDNNVSTAQYPAAWQFATIQGSNGWHQQGYSGTGNWTDLPTYTATPSRWTGGDAWIDAFILNPGTSSNQWVAREWIAPSAGTVDIRGRVFKDQTGAIADVLIERNGTPIWPASGGNPYYTVGSSDINGVSTDVSISVSSGDVIRFVEYGHGAGSSSAASWTPSINYR